MVAATLALGVCVANWCGIKALNEPMVAATTYLCLINFSASGYRLKRVVQVSLIYSVSGSRGRGGGELGERQVALARVKHVAVTRQRHRDDCIHVRPDQEKQRGGGKGTREQSPMQTLLTCRRP